jgi:hypothetical protein
LKTREVIAALQKADPTGELEVVADGQPIYVVERLPAYYDGSLHMLVQNKAMQCFNIVGYKITNEGEKVRLHLISLEGLLFDDPEMPVDLSEMLEGPAKERYQKQIEEWRQDGRTADEPKKD